MFRKVLSIEEAETILPQLGSVFSFDTETTHTKYDRLRITGLSLCDGKLNLYIPFKEGERHHLKRLWGLLNPTLLIAHNWVFDAKVLHKEGVDISSIPCFDTMIASHLLDENRPKSLKFLTKTLLKREVKDYDDKLSHYSKEFFEYALDDSLNTWELYELFKHWLVEQKLEYLFYNIEMPFQECLLEMQLTGIKVNVDLLREQQVILKEEINKLTIECLNLLGKKYYLTTNFLGEVLITSSVKLSSPQQLQKILFEDLGLEPVEFTPTGSPATGTFTLKKYRDVPFVDALYKLKICQKLMDSFVSEEGQIITNLEEGNILRPRFNDVGARTGRLSSSNPNCQQLPKPKDYSPVNVRETITVPKGYNMIAVDYSGQEIAVTAQLCKDENLLKMLNGGYDMHLAIANKFSNLGIPEEKLVSTHPEHESLKKKWDKARGVSKAITFGLLYGKTAQGFAKDFGVSDREAQKMIDDYYATMPRLRPTIEKYHKLLDRDGFVTNLVGRRRRFKKEEWGYSNKAYRQTFNFAVQGFSADMLRSAMVVTHNSKKKKKEWDLKAIMTVHDEAVYQVKEEYAQEAKEFIIKCFEKVCENMVVRVKATADVGLTYADAK